jgi:hypothetical protein
MKTKIIAAFLITGMVLTGLACGGKSPTPTTALTPPAIVSNEPSPPALTPTATVSSQPSPTPETALEHDFKLLVSEITTNIKQADFVVLGTITDFRYEPSNKMAYTIFTLTVDQMIKGDSDTSRILIKLQGGMMNEHKVVSSTEGYFELSDQAMVCLKKGEKYYSIMRPFGTLWRSNADGARMGIAKSYSEMMTSDETIDLVKQIMKDNNIPVAWPDNETRPGSDNSTGPTTTSTSSPSGS